MKSYSLTEDKFNRLTEQAARANAAEHRRLIQVVMREKQKTVNGLSLSVYGSNAPTVICLHGGPGVFGYMENLCETISSYSTAIYYQQRGSQQKSQAVKIHQHVSDLDSIVESVSHEPKPIILGHSWGAMLALLYASQKSTKIQKLIMVGSGPLNKEMGQLFLNEILYRFGDQRNYFDELWSKLEQEKDEKTLQLYANKYLNEVFDFYQNGKTKDARHPALHWDFKASRETMIESDEFVDSGRYEDAFAQISCPITLLHGSHDPIQPEILFKLTRKYQPSASTHKIENGGHYPWIGQSEFSFLEILKREIKSKS